MASIEHLSPQMENLSIGTQESFSSGASYSFSESFSSRKGCCAGQIYSCADHLNEGHTLTKEEAIDAGCYSVSEDYSTADKFPRLVALEQLPWSDQDILDVLQHGRARDISALLSLELLQKISYSLQRPLIRIAKEAQRLSSTFCKCTKYEIKTAIKLILPRSLAEKCINNCLKAGALFAISEDNFRQSKSARCGLHFSVGQFSRWILDAQVSLRIHDLVSVYLTACMEMLVEEIVLATIGECKSEKVITTDMYDSRLAMNAELWGVFQPYEHLVCARNANGVLSLPTSLDLLSSPHSSDLSKNKGKKQERINGTLLRNLEQSLLATCVASVVELGDLVSRAMHHWYNKPSSNHTSSPSKHNLMTWSPSALHTLFHYVKCSDVEHVEDLNLNPPSVQLEYERPFTVLPPLIEWIRVATAHTEYRHSWLIDSDDVRQAARLLLPGVDCPPRELCTDEALCTSRQLDAETCAERFYQDVAFRMLACGRSDLVPQALLLLGQEKINTINDQGLSPLMYACMRGDEAMVQILLDAGADLNLAIPDKASCIHPEIRGWTPLHFATVHSHVSVVQLLLENGAKVEGSSLPGEDNFTETPLQLAVAGGHYDLTALLLSKGADPYYATLHKNGAAIIGKGKCNAFTLTACHGHQNILRKLLSQPISKKTSEALSLEEILAEGTDQEKTKFDKNNKLKNKAEEDNKNSEENVYMTIENEYVTIEELWEQDRLKKLAESNLNEQQIAVLQESLYHSSEHGYLDTALEIRALGVPWTIYTWTCCLQTAYLQHRKAMLQSLLKDFSTLREDKVKFLDCLSLLFNIFKNSKNEAVGHLLAIVLSELYGREPMPGIKEIRQTPHPYIDAHYVNNPEMSDIQFLIEGQVFYAHKIILINSSNRFKAMLSNKFSEGSQPCIEISDIRFKIFEYIMQYLYHGGAQHIHIESNDLLDLLGSANFFLLDGLQRYCEILLSKSLSFDNCVSIYKYARLYNAVELMSYCEGYFLQNLPTLLKTNENFKRVLYSHKLHHQDMIQGLMLTMTAKLQAKLRARHVRKESYC